jgi:hypothetical protein
MVANTSETASVVTGLPPRKVDMSLGRMGQRFQPRQLEKSAGAFDGVDEPKTFSRILMLFGSCSKRTSSTVDEVEVFARLRQELAQRSSMGVGYSRRKTPPAASEIGKERQCVVKRFNFGCGAESLPRGWSAKRDR